MIKIKFDGDGYSSQGAFSGYHKFVESAVEGVGDFAGDLVGGITGETQADAIREGTAQQVAAQQAAIEEQRRSKGEAIGFLEPEVQDRLSPFAQIGQQAISQADILTNPQSQISFLQSNPLFNLALENANQQTQQAAAARGRLSAGDTLQQLAANTLLTAQPLLANQQQNVSNLLSFGADITGRQQGLDFARQQALANAALGVGGNVSNLLAGIGEAQSAGAIGAANARTQGLSNILNLGGTLGSAAILASDINLKENIKKIDEENGFNIYSWDWNDKAKEIGLNGSSKGVIAQEVIDVNPSAVIVGSHGYLTVNYDEIGVSHG